MADDKDIGGYLRGMDPQAWGQVVENYFLDAANHDLAQANQQLQRAYQDLVDRYNELHAAAVELSEGYCANRADMDAAREVLPEFLDEGQMQKLRERHKAVAARHEDELREKFPLLKNAHR